MENFGSFENKFLHLLNPLPEVTVEQLYQRAKVTLRKTKSAKQSAFPLELRYGGGTDLKTSTLLPGKSMRVEERFGREVIQDFKPQGDLCATNPGLAWFSKDEERTQAIIDALHIAEQHYHTVGAAQIDGVRHSRGHSESDIERYRSSVYGTYFLAMAKEEMIREAREKLQQKVNGKG